MGAEARDLDPDATWLGELVQRVRPGARLLGVTPLKVDAGNTDDGTTKATGYGQPLKIDIEVSGARERLVLHTAAANQFGHDWRADRAAEMLVAFDTFEHIPRHVPALDVGAFGDAGLVSLSGCGEFYLVTAWADGDPYAEQLRAVARTGRATPRDLEQAGTLASYLASLHQPVDQPGAYARATRDLVGSGEGIFGITDSYPPGVAGACVERLDGIEERCRQWRWKLRERSDRLRRIHGDFHPFNVIFSDEGRLSLLDASRGSLGDAANDLTAMAVNYVFFGLESRGSWKSGFRPLWYRFIEQYLDESGDTEVLEIAPPYFAWRCLVVADPAWYPDVSGAVRDRLLGLAERALDRGRLDPNDAEGLFR